MIKGRPKQQDTRVTRVFGKALEEIRAAYVRDELPRQREERQRHLEALAEYLGDPTPLKSAAQKAGLKPAQTITEFMVGLEFRTNSAEEHRFLALLLCVAATGNDVRDMLGIPKVKRGHKMASPLWRDVAREVQMRVSEGDRRADAIRAVAGIIAGAAPDEVGQEIIDRVHTQCIRSKAWLGKCQDGYEYRAATLGTKITRHRGNKR